MHLVGKIMIAVALIMAGWMAHHYATQVNAQVQQFDRAMQIHCQATPTSTLERHWVLR